MSQTAAAAKLEKAEKGISELVRPLYSAGLLLRDDDLKQAVDYTRELSRLLFRSFFGCGVICGLDLEVDIHCNALRIVVNPGVALDCHGDAIHVPKKVVLSIAEACDGKLPDELWVLIRHYEKCCAPRVAMCASEEDESSTSVCTREHEGYEIKVTNKDWQCWCGCKDGKPHAKNDCHCVHPEDAPCYQDHYAGKCHCCGEDCNDCSCDWVVLAKLSYRASTQKWTADYAYRRFIRPLLMQDPRTYRTSTASSLNASTAEPESAYAAAYSMTAEDSPAPPAPPAPPPEAAAPASKPKVVPGKGSGKGGGE